MVFDVKNDGRQGSVQALISDAANRVVTGDKVADLLADRIGVLDTLCGPVDVDTGEVVNGLRDLLQRCHETRTALVFREPAYFAQSGLARVEECSIDPGSERDHIGFCRLAADLASIFGNETLSDDDWEELSSTNRLA